MGRLMSCVASWGSWIMPPFLLSPDSRVWLDPSGLLGVHHFTSFLTKSSLDQPLFPISNLICKLMELEKVEAFCQTTVLDKLNICDNLQIRRPYKSLSPHMTCAWKMESMGFTCFCIVRQQDFLGEDSLASMVKLGQGLILFLGSCKSRSGFLGERRIGELYGSGRFWLLRG